MRFAALLAVMWLHRARFAARALRPAARVPRRAARRLAGGGDVRRFAGGGGDIRVVDVGDDFDFGDDDDDPSADMDARLAHSFSGGVGRAVGRAGGGAAVLDDRGAAPEFAIEVERARCPAREREPRGAFKMPCAATRASRCLQGALGAWRVPEHPVERLLDTAQALPGLRREVSDGRRPCGARVCGSVPRLFEARAKIATGRVAATPWLPRG